MGLGLLIVVVVSGGSGVAVVRARRFPYSEGNFVPALEVSQVYGLELCADLQGRRALARLENLGQGLANPLSVLHAGPYSIVQVELNSLSLRHNLLALPTRLFRSSSWPQTR